MIRRLLAQLVLWNTLAALFALGLIFAFCFTPYRYYFRYTLISALFSAGIGIFLSVLFYVQRFRIRAYLDEWLREPGIAFLMGTALVVPLGLSCAQWASTHYQAKIVTEGIVVQKKERVTRGKSGRRFLFKEVWVLSDMKSLKRFNLSFNSDIFERVQTGQWISIHHFPWIRDTYLEVELSPTVPHARAN